MRLDLYQAETAQVAKEQGALLDDVNQKLIVGTTLSGLEQNDVLHALQVLIENAIGKTKQILKASGEPVPISAYDSFNALVRIKQIPDSDLMAWNAIVGLRNRIVHEYMNIDIAKVLEIVREERHLFVVEFLLAPIRIGK